MPNSARIDELQKKFNENPRRYFAPLADEYRKAGDLQGAIELCRSHLAQQPGHMSGHIVLGKALYEGGELDEARQTFETALGLDPENLIALRHLGDIARQQGDAYGARQWYQRVLDADPRNDEIAAQIQLLDDMPATEAFGGAGAEAPELAPDLSPDLADAPDTLAESTVPDGTLPPALEPSAIAYLADDEPTVEVPAYRPAASTAGPDALDIDMSALEAPEPFASAAPVVPAVPAQPSNDIGLESMEFVAPARDEQGGRADGLERPEYDFESHVVDGAVRGEATPAAFVTETMAELYLQQGFTDEALQVYRQLLAANPADENLRARVQQLEGGGRSTLAFDVSEDVVRAAQERHSRGNRPTARRFFASLAARRAPGHGGAGDDAYAQGASSAFGATMDVDHADAAPSDPMPANPYAYGAMGADTSALDAAALIGSAGEVGGPSGVSFDTPDEQAYEAQGYEAQGFDAQPAEHAGAFDLTQHQAATYDGEPHEGAEHDSALYEAAPQETAGYDTAPYDTTQHDSTAHDAGWDTEAAPPDTLPQPQSAAFDVAAFEAETWDEAPAAPSTTPPSAGGEGAAAGTVDALFGGASGATASDEAAANALAGAFAGTPAAIPAVRPATGELSLDQVFRETPRRSDSQRRDASGFSFDQFFSEGQGAESPAAPSQPTAPGGEPGEGGENDEQFNAWLEGLKQK